MRFFLLVIFLFNTTSFASTDYRFTTATVVGSMVVLENPHVIIDQTTYPLSSWAYVGSTGIQIGVCKEFGFGTTRDKWSLTGLNYGSPTKMIRIGNKGFKDALIEESTQYYQHLICELEPTAWKNYNSAVSKVQNPDGSITFIQPYLEMGQNRVSWELEGFDGSLCKLYGYNSAVDVKFRQVNPIDSIHEWGAAFNLDGSADLKNWELDINNHYDLEPYWIIEELRCADNT